MKYNKIVSLLALGTLFGATLLSSQQAFAEESGTVASNSATTSSTQQSTETTNPGSTEDTGNSETPIPDPEPATPHNLLANGAPIANNTFSDANGAQISFQYTSDNGLVENTAVHYTVTAPENVKIKEVKVINATTQALIHSSAEVNGVFTMPDADVSIQLETVKEEKPAPTPTPKPEEKPSGNTSGNSNNQNNNSNKDKPATNSNNQTTQNPTVNTPSANQEQPAAARQPGAEDAAAADIRVPSNQTAPTFSNEVQTAIVQEAYRHLGKPYVWGAKGPNAFDCSGLAYVVYANATGHNIGGWTGDQQYAGTQIPVSEAQPGDLLFWGAPTSVTTHVAIYIGNGQYIHAPQPGDVVKIGSISAFTPTFAVRVNISGLPKATGSLSNAFGEYSTNQPFIFNKNQTTDQFIKKIGEISREIGQKNGIYSSVMIAQAILESGSGNSSLASEPNYNLFGIKGKYKDQGVTFQTLEQDNVGASFQITSEFRKYPSYKESLEDYAKLIKKGISGNEDFYKATWKDQTESYKDATEHLQGRYATDKQYAEKLNAIIKAYDLTEFDHAKETKEKTTGPKIEATKTTVDVNDEIQSKLIASIVNSPRIPQVMSTKHFVNLFRSESLIALAATALPAKKTLNEALPTTASIYVSLSNGLLAIIPPMK
ncbi:glucosaminidase domain-containing protein [Enterococcus raffinosus]|uniref:NlpC/P60 family protein n=1 Tax=Enterococcus raffinosus TaxID=71452 RepID=A0AAW8T6D1_9ENTE|nr:glucosaminidase domain-containing protein [Enterococcus raffinosus]MDT2543807.1 NlpC/P60 family protein [Enterococcus raffinosus]